MMRVFLLAVLAAQYAATADWYLFTSFRGNGETGVFLALSQDGRNWTPLNQNQPWLKPGAPGMLMRDPFLTRGPDGVWHLLWTCGWTRPQAGGPLTIGQATSEDLLVWSEQQRIPVFENEPTARNAWAPEAAWDAARKEWIIFWSTTIPGRFPQTDQTGDQGYNHRIYAMTTRDWKQFSPPRLWFDPGFNSIDATLAHDGKRWVLIFKDERLDPQQKKLRLAFSDSPQGPWRDVSEPFSKDWVEGPSAVKIGGEWWIHYDHYTRPHYYGAIKTRDWKSFEDVSGQVSFPDDHRHGTVVRITEKEARLLDQQSR